MMRRPQSDEEGKSAGENPSRTSKLPAGGVVLLVLVGLLAAALIVIYRLSFAVLMTNQTVQTLKEENEALRRNLSGVNLSTTMQPKCPPPPQCPPPLKCPPPPTCPHPQCPPPPEVKCLTCLKCEAGWEPHGGKCYYFSTSKSSWTDSRRSCQHLGSDLVKIDSREEQRFLESKLKEKMKKPPDAFWIGLTDSQTEGRWFWVDGSLLDPSLSFWSDGEPNNWTGQNPAGEDCGRMDKKGNGVDLKSWDDHSCHVQLRSICEKPAEM